MLTTQSTVRAHKLRDYQLSGWKEKICGRWSYKDLVNDPSWFKGWISFDSVTWNPRDRKLYCGLNSLDGDILYRFDPGTEQFESLNTLRWADKFDSKIHRTLLQNPQDGCFYFGTSLLHDANQQHEAPGGKLVRYNPSTDHYDVLGIPAPHLYLQSIAADWKRGVLYAFTYPSESLLRFDLPTGKSRTLAYIGNAQMFSQPHNAVVDKDGYLWGTYAETRAWDEVTGRYPIRLFKYHPDQDRFTWFEHGLSRLADKEQLVSDPPKPTGVQRELVETRHKEDYGFCDSMLYDGDRYIYAGTTAGVLSRIDTVTAQVTKVAHIMATGRFPALAIDSQGVLFGGGGVKGHTQVIRWDPRQDQIYDYGDLVETKTGARIARIHELAVDDQERIYLAENDNHQRSSYLWTIESQ